MIERQFKPGDIVLVPARVQAVRQENGDGGKLGRTDAPAPAREEPTCSLEVPGGQMLLNVPMAELRFLRESW